MNKPREPQKPYPPIRRWLDGEVREKIDAWGRGDEPSYPDVTIGTIEAWAEEHGVDPRAVTVQMQPSDTSLDMMYVAKRPVTQEMRDEVEAEYQQAMKVYSEETLPAYEAAKAKYDIDLRAYYQWMHDHV
jgi:hypothetical protein